MPDRPDECLSGFDRTDAILYKIFLGFIATYPDMTFCGGAAWLHMECKNGERAGAFRVEEG